MSDSRHRFKHFFRELRRRRVVQVAAAYAAVGWMVIEVTTTVVPELDLPGWIPPTVILFVLVGFPVTLALSWVFDVTSRGVHRTEPLQSDEPDQDEVGTTVPSGSRTMTYAGIGMVIALAGIGSYVYVQSGSMQLAGSDPVADAPHFLAVLPFTNTSPDAANEYFADGVTEDILTHLAVVPDFTVISRTTTMGYKGSEKSVREIADELGVQYVLEGSIRLVDDQVRITAQLVDGETDHHLWGDGYERQVEDIFDVQTEIARAIVDALEVELASGVAARIERQPTDDTEAYDLFLLGRESLYRYDVEGIEQAIALLGQALERDAAFTRARAWLARAYALYAINHGMGANWADSAVAEGRQAVAEQPDLSEAHTALGTALYAAGRATEATASFERAMDLNPNDWIAAVNLGGVYLALGRMDEAIPVTRRSLERDPVRAHYAYANLSLTYAQLGLDDRAESAIERALALSPEDANIMWVHGWLNLLRGRRETALQVADSVASIHGDDPRAGWSATMTFIFAGEPERARRVAEAVYAMSPRLVANPYVLGVLYGYTLERTGDAERADSVLTAAERYAHERIDAGDELVALRYSLAAIYAMRGEHDRAFHWLDEAISGGWIVARTTERDPLLEGLHGDARFQIALDRMEHALAPMRERVEQEGW